MSRSAPLSIRALWRASAPHEAALPSGANCNAFGSAAVRPTEGPVEESPAGAICRMSPCQSVPESGGGRSGAPRL
eukprot:scaffold202456_cov28-Tisochrysis_lutea.AAC.6